MHASLAFVNGAGVADSEQLMLMNTLLTAPSGEQRSTPEPRKEESRRSQRGAKPGSFKNDPPDPKNPNEERERHLKKIKK